MERKKTGGVKEKKKGERLGKVISREESTVPTSGFKKSQGLAKQVSL